MSTLDGADKEVRLPILLPGIGGTKLLGVPVLPHLSTEKAGNLISKASMELFDQWDCKILWLEWSSIQLHPTLGT